MRGDFLIAELLATPWALRRDVLQNHLRIAARRINGQSADFFAYDYSDDEPGERITVFEARRRQANAPVSGSYVAVIPVFGTIIQRGNLFTEWCGASSTMQISNALNDAINDPDISDVILEIDSPGGSVYGVQELGDEIYAARENIKITAMANSLAASAAYWLGTQANEFYVTPGGEVGSIGVWMAHEDWSKAMEEAGIKVTTISAGDYKTEGNPYEPLSDEAKAFMKSRVDDYHNQFIDAVARGRGVSTQFVKNGMGKGRVLGAQAAKAENMVDGIMTMQDLIKSRKNSGQSQKTGTNRSRQAEYSRQLQLAGLNNAHST